MLKGPGSYIQRKVCLSDTLFTLFQYIVYRYGIWLSLLWIFYIVQVYSIFHAELFGGIFLFLLQILAEFFNI
jgi:hypothetical protein